MSPWRTSFIAGNWKRQLLGLPDVDGALVGGANLDRVACAHRRGRERARRRRAVTIEGA
jgi:hypothetical protein